MADDPATDDWLTMETGRITIVSGIDADGTPVSATHFTGTMGLVEKLGLLELAKDTAIRESMGELD